MPHTLHPARARSRTASQEDHERAVRVTRDSPRLLRDYFWTEDARWLLYLQETGGDENWHLFRIDLDAPEHLAVDLTPLPEGSRVFSVDPLTAAPGSVLVTMNKVPRHIDYFLIDVATGETTARLPAGRPE